MVNGHLVRLIYTLEVVTRKTTGLVICKIYKSPNTPTPKKKNIGVLLQI